MLIEAAIRYEVDIGWLAAFDRNAQNRKAQNRTPRREFERLEEYARETPEIVELLRLHRGAESARRARSLALKKEDRAVIAADPEANPPTTMLATKRGNILLQERVMVLRRSKGVNNAERKELNELRIRARHLEQRETERQAEVDKPKADLAEAHRWPRSSRP